MKKQLCSDPGCKFDARDGCVKCRYVYCAEHLYVYRVSDYYRVSGMSLRVDYVCRDCFTVNVKGGNGRAYQLS